MRTSNQKQAGGCGVEAAAEVEAGSSGRQRWEDERTSNERAGAGRRRGGSGAVGLEPSTIAKTEKRSMKRERRKGRRQGGGGVCSSAAV